ncbi:MAG: amidohydrolase family protein [Alphaproteobacteria bacterium]
MESAPHRIDVHHHIIPKKYLDALGQSGISTSGGIPYPDWSPEKALGLMDRNGIRSALTSVSSPGVYFGNVDLARELSRICNDVSAELVAGNPDRFGAFAHVPLPDIDAALAEIERALDELKLDGVILLASIGDHFLGDPAFDAVYEELNRRKAVVFVHPTVHPTTKELRHEIPAFLMEFLFDTTRAAVNLIHQGTMERYPDIKFILSHAGGTLPYFAWRLSMGGLIDPRLEKRVPKGFAYYLNRFYYDTAISTSPQVMAALMAVVEPSHILFGSDWPYAPEVVTERSVAALSELEALDEAMLAGVEHGHAEALFPRLAIRK